MPDWFAYGGIVAACLFLGLAAVQWSRCDACGRRMFVRRCPVVNLSRGVTYVFHARCRDAWLDEWVINGDNSTLYWRKGRARLTRRTTQS